jgi:hypothetical protein
VQLIKKLAKDTKNLKKAFTQLQKTNERDSDLSGSESEEEDLHFQFGDGFQFTQMKVKQTAIEFSYAFLCQSGAQHGNLKVDLSNDFTTGSNQYPKTCQQMLHLMDKYSKTVVVPKMTPSEGSSFTQKGGRGGRGSKG